MKSLFMLAAMLITLSTLSFAAFGQPGKAAPTPTPAPAKALAAPEIKFKVGEMAPDFTLSDTTGAKVKLSDFRGKANVVLAFYVFAFTGG